LKLLGSVKVVHYFEVSSNNWKGNKTNW